MCDFVYVVYVCILPCQPWFSTAPGSELIKYLWRWVYMRFLNAVPVFQGYTWVNHLPPLWNYINVLQRDFGSLNRFWITQQTLDHAAHPGMLCGLWITQQTVTCIRFLRKTTAPFGCCLKYLLPAASAVNGAYSFTNSLEWTVSALQAYEKT